MFVTKAAQRHDGYAQNPHQSSLLLRSSHIFVFVILVA